jgi:hypothetical protein
MASENSNPSFQLDPATVLALLTVVGGLFLATQRLSSDRPILPPERHNNELSEEKFDTRLWQDPFSALASQPEPGLFGALEEDLSRQAAAAGTNGVQILQVLVPVDPSTENKETRTRVRYAVISALAQAGYEPERSEQIGVWRAPGWPSRLDFTNFANVDRSTNGFRPVDLYAPFEWYLPKSPGATQAARTLVLWLDEDGFSDKPYQRLQLFLNRLGSRLDGRGSNISVRTIGPFYSSTLKDLIEDGSRNASNLVSRGLSLRDSELFLALPRATERALLPGWPGNWSPQEKTRENVRRALTENRAFSNVVNLAVTDASLANDAILALKDRGIDLGDVKNHLVLISDEDTFVSRAIEGAYPRNFANEAASSYDLGDPRADSPTNLHVYSYLKGLDGQELTTGTNPAPPNGSEPPRKGATWKFDVNKAEGPNQLDYLERLALKIERMDAGLRAGKKGRVRAIGVGGGDVYDTLLILQAFRPHFPDAVFFTTDLDARLWAPKEWPWTHNLLVFSGFGLGLNDQLQHKIGGFRDSRQTAVFAATLAALRDPAMEALLPQLNNTRPRRFEIARTGPLDFSQVTPWTNSIHADRRTSNPGGIDWGSVATIIILLGAGFCLALTLSAFARRFTLERRQYLAEPLWLTEEDIGGFRGMWHLENATRLDGPMNPEKPAASQSTAFLDRARRVFGELPGDEAELKFQPEDILRPASIADVLRAPATLAIYSSIQAQIKVLAGGDGPNFEAALALGIARAFNDLILSPDPDGVLESICLEEGSRENAKWLLRHNTWDLLASRPRAKQQQRVLRRLILQDLFAGLVKPLPAATLLLKDAHNLLHKLNTALFGDPDEGAPGRDGGPRGGFKVVDTKSLDSIVENRAALDQALAEQFDNYYGTAREKNEPEERVQRRFGVPRAAADARRGSWLLHRMRKFRLRVYQCFVVPLLAASAGAGLYWLAQSAGIENGGILGGTSAWPTVFLCVATTLLAQLFFMESHLQLRAAAVYTSRLFRLPFLGRRAGPNTPSHSNKWRLADSLRTMIQRASLPCVPAPLGFVDAETMWLGYQEKGRFRHRLFRAVRLMAPYLAAVMALMTCLGEDAWSIPALQSTGLRNAYMASAWAAFFGFLLLTFWTIDAAYLCRWFIQRLTEGPTRYPEATLKHFSDLRGRIDYEALAEFIDVKIIAEITERVGAMLYFPAIILFMILLAHNTFTFVWPWRAAWWVVVGCHFAVALLSVIILQNAAKRARDASVASLEAKLQQARAAQAATEKERASLASDEGEKLLEEMRTLRSGALVGFAGNPVIGALLVPSGGTVIIELIRYFLEK